MAKRAHQGRVMEDTSLSAEILTRLSFIETQIARPPRPPLHLNDSLIAAFLAFSRSEGNTEKWVGAQRRYLRWWAEQLDGVSLRSVSLELQILPALDSVAGGHQPRIAVIKRLYSWLRTVRFQVEPAEDPTFGRLHVPQSAPAQLDEEKAIDVATYRAARVHLAQHWRDSLDVLAATGWHLTELDRFIRGGSI